MLCPLLCTDLLPLTDKCNILVKKKLPSRLTAWIEQGPFILFFCTGLYIVRGCGGCVRPHLESCIVTHVYICASSLEGLWHQTVCHKFMNTSKKGQCSSSLSLLPKASWARMIGPFTCFFSEGPVLGGCSHTLGCNQCGVFPVVWEVRCSMFLHPHHSSGHRCESCGKPVSLGVLESLRFTVSLCVIYVCVGIEMWRPEVGIGSIFYLQCLDRVS